MLPRHQAARLIQPCLPTEKHLPEGQCRYIMLHPEVKGLRCACVTFSLNRETPGSSCDCGHQACYHLPTREHREIEREQVDSLKRRITELEEKVQGERDRDRRALILRISHLEELLEKYKNDTEADVRSAFRALEGLWNSVGRLQRHASGYDDQMEALVDASQAIHNDLNSVRSKLTSVDDLAMQLEDRIDSLESPRVTWYRHASLSASPAAPPAIEEASTVTSKTSTPASAVVHGLVTADNVAVKPQSWTVHVSLLPKASQPMPFEQNTAAYRRCVSRGLHRMVSILGESSFAIRTAISEAFVELLRGRDWMPLEARICDAEALEGLPMLKQLPLCKLDYAHDYDFLKNNCATVDDQGKINALYIAMRNDSLTWPELHRSKPFEKGREESCWNYDPVLDGPRADDDDFNSKEISQKTALTDDVPSAGDILRTWSPPTARLKRNASAISRASSFGSLDSEAGRSKTPRRHPNTSIDRLSRMAEAV